MEFDKVIKDRFSVRQFKNQPLSQEDINKILNAGHLAPTGCNFQPQRILVLNDKEALEKLKNCTKCHFNAPTVFVVCHNKKESWIRPYDSALSSSADAVIVATHMMLKATDIGVGCCYVMHFNPTMLKSSFSFPEEVEPVALLVMGYPLEDAKPLDMHYNKRALEQVVYYNKF